MLSFTSPSVPVESDANQRVLFQNETLSNIHQNLTTFQNNRSINIKDNYNPNLPVISFTVQICRSYSS